MNDFLKHKIHTTRSGKDDPPIPRPVVILEAVILDNPADDEAQVDLFKSGRGDNG
jgi:hypothetical protein